MFFTHADYLNPQRQELINWFSRNAPGLGKLYEGALYMVYTNGFPGRVRFVAHAVREIRNRLPDVIAGPISKKRLDYKSRLDQLTDEWKRSGFPIDGSLPMDIDEEGKFLIIRVFLYLFTYTKKLQALYAIIMNRGKLLVKRLGAFFYL